MVGGVTYKYSADWIRALESEEHWRLYWRQQNIMQGLLLPGQHVLEIGLGSGFTANYLRSKGVRVSTIDIDADKSPDIVGNIVEYEFAESFDHVLGFEVFEHIPFAEFEKILKKLAKACKGHFFLSLPRNERTWLRCWLQLPRVSPLSFELVTRRGKIADPHHFWEADDGKISRQRLETAFRDAGFRPVRSAKAGEGA